MAPKYWFVVIATAFSLWNASLTISTTSRNRRFSSKASFHSDLNALAAKTLREVFRGPLDEKTITLLIDGEAEVFVNPDGLLMDLESPFFLMRAKMLEYEEDNYDGEPTETGKAIETANDEMGMDESYSEFEDFLSPRVLVGVMGGDIPSAFSSPPPTWSPSAVLLLNLGLLCDPASLLQTRLLEQTSRVAVMCLNLPRDGQTGAPSLSFHVFTWRPFQPVKKLLPLGRWSPSAFPDWASLFVDRFASLNGATLHASSDEGDMPFVLTYPDGTFDGTTKRIMDALGEWMDFNFTLTRRASDKKWGEKVNDTWVGMLGDVWRGEKDLAINYFSVTLERVEDFDYSVSYYNEGFGFSILVPPPLPRWLSLIYPFTGLVWAAVGGSFLVTSFILYILSFERERFSPFQSVITVVQSLMNQGLDKVPEAWLLRVFLGVWWITAYIIVLSYTCNLIAVLTVPVYPKRIYTIQELADSDFRVCMLDYGEFVPEALATSSHSALFALGAKLDMTPVVETEFFGEEGCVEMVLEGKHAHLEGFSYVQLLYSKMGHGEQVYFMREQVYEANLAFFYKKNTAWKFKFDTGIRRLVEAGLVHKWYDDIMDTLKRQHSKANAKPESSSEQSLTLAHLQGPFLIFALGHVLSAVIFFMEYVV